MSFDVCVASVILTIDCCELQVKTEVQRNMPSGNWLTIMIKTAIALGNNKS